MGSLKRGRPSLRLPMFALEKSRGCKVASRCRTPKLCKRSIHFERDVRPAEIMNRDLLSWGRLLRLDFSFKLRCIVEGSNQVNILLALDSNRFWACRDYSAPKPISVLAVLCHHWIGWN